MAATKLTADALDKLDDAKLADELAKAKDELFKLRFQSATGQLESHGRLRAVRKDIARIYTVLQERSLGITDDPDLESANTDAEPEAATVTRTKAATDE